MDKVLCKNCRFLVIVHPESVGRIEATHDVRNTGKHAFVNQAGQPRQYVPNPICHAGRRRDWNDWQVSFNAEIKDNPKAFLDQIDMPLDCDSFQPYEPGIGPKQLDDMNSHSAMIEVQQKLLALQQTVFDWRQQQARDDEKLTMRIQAIEQVRHNENRTDSEAISRRELWVIGAFTIVAAVLGAVVAAVMTVWLAGGTPP